MHRRVRLLLSPARRARSSALIAMRALLPSLANRVSTRRTHIWQKKREPRVMPSGSTLAAQASRPGSSTLIRIRWCRVQRESTPRSPQPPMQSLALFPASSVSSPWPCASASPKATPPWALPSPASSALDHAGEAANVDQRWIGEDAPEIFEDVLDCRPCVINDADAAGLAEVIYGAGFGN